MTPPKAPPAPPTAAELLKHGPTATTAAKPLSSKERRAAMVQDLRRIAAAVPTPNVVDSHLHGQQLRAIANDLEKLDNV